MNGLRLGIDFGPEASNPELHITLQNVGAAVENVYIGNEVGKGIAFDFQFFAIAPDGTTREGFELNSFTPLGGLVTPVGVSLRPGLTHEIHIPLKNILLIDGLSAITKQENFADLLRERPTLLISLDSSRTLLCSSWTPLCWEGKVTSGKLKAP